MFSSGKVSTFLKKIHLVPSRKIVRKCGGREETEWGIFIQNTLSKLENSLQKETTLVILERYS